MISNLYIENEQDIDKTLLSLSCVADKNYGLVKNIRRVRQYHDDPKFWYYSADINDTFSKSDGGHFHTKGSGASIFLQKDALLKCLCESLERYCNFNFLNKSTFAIKSINEVGGKYIDPRTISSFSKSQLAKPEFSRYRINGNSIFRWTTCTSLLTGEAFLIPSQFIYLSYPHLKNEPSIYTSISTGVAGGANLSAAIVRGICEIIERDAFMIFYLNKLKPKSINLSEIKDARIQKLLSIVNRYKMELIVLDITTDFEIPTITSILVNRTSVGKAISIGLKCDFNILNAIIGSIEEALHTRSWVRSDYENNPENVGIHDLYRNSDIRHRALLWYSTNVIKNLDFWLNSPKTKTIQKIDMDYGSGFKLKMLVKMFKKKNYDLYYKDITVKELGKLNYFIVKVIIPKMQPLYLDENHPLLGSERLYKVPQHLGYRIKKQNQLNKFPHPFL